MSTLTSGNVTVSCSLSADTTGNLVFQSGGNVTAMTIDSSQNVGIGTSSPGFKLEVVGGTNNGIHIKDAASATVFGGLFTQASSLGLYARSNHALTFGTNDTERARIDTSGNLLINTTARTGGERMALWYSSNSGPGLNIRDTSAQNGNTFIQFNNGATTAGSITSNGTTTMTYGSASDYRLKENLTPLTGALAKVAALQPKVGNWKVDGSEFVGFLAHELQEVFPDAVVGEKDRVDADGNPLHQMVDTGSASIIATLAAAIQEQQQMIEELKAEVAALKGASA